MPLVLTAAPRSTAVAATFWLVVLLVNNLSSSLLVRRRGRLQDLYSANDVNSRGVSYDDDSSVDKRDSSGSGRGTCTCTCETKPASSSSSSSSSAEESPASSGVVHPLKSPETIAPQTAALMRTATGTRQSSTAAKAKPQLHRQPQNHGGGGSGIISVPPMQDYGLGNAYEPVVNEQSNYVEPVGESQHQQQQQEQEQLENAQQQEADDEWAQERFPWKLLPDRMCFREMCSGDRDCCRRFNICDRSARVCVDCWYGSTCTSERDCCLKYPYCQRNWRTDPDGTRHVVGGKCTNEL